MNWGHFFNWKCNVSLPFSLTSLLPVLSLYKIFVSVLLYALDKILVYDQVSFIYSLLSFKEKRALLVYLEQFSSLFTFNNTQEKQCSGMPCTHNTYTVASPYRRELIIRGQRGVHCLSQRRVEDGIPPASRMVSLGLGDSMSHLQE